MKQILITGGTGFFGKSILDYFSRHDCDSTFTVLSRHGLSAEFLAQVNRNNTLNINQILGDVRTFDIGDSQFDVVVHAATPARVDVPEGEMRSIVIDGTAHAIEQAQRCGAKKFMMVSSGGVYGKGFARPVSEDDKPRPYTVYGKSKLEAERMAIGSGLYTLIPRCFAFVGKYLDRSAHFAIGNFIQDALSGKDIVIQGDGSPMRSYMYADDLVEWLWAILERGEFGRPYNVGSDAAISIRDLATTVRDALDSSSFVRVLGKSVSGAANYYVPVVERVRKELGLSITESLADAIRRSAQKCVAK